MADVVAMLLAAAQRPLNDFPLKVAAERAAMTMPEVLARPLGALATTLATFAPPSLSPGRASTNGIACGDRVKSAKHALASWPNFGGYVLAVGGGKALVLWDMGVLTVDELADLKRMSAPAPG